MKKIVSLFLVLSIVLGGIIVGGCSASAGPGNQGQNNTSPGNQESKPDRPDGQSGDQYSLAQAMSDQAQLSTIAFSGLAFITGSSGADSFMPPGKVADFFGFQYMRDVDVAGYGHNTTFLTKAANNVLYILNDEQKGQLIALAKEQAPMYVNFAYNRFPLMDAFRRNLEGNIPDGASGLDINTVAAYTGQLYQWDADLSYNRAVVVGGIIRSLDNEQKAYLEQMKFNDSSTWPAVEENEDMKKGMSQTEFMLVMTYASEMFSWYKGDIDADVYFCPERHGTYFGGFYMKDYPAMHNPDYFISTSLTGDKGQQFLETLTSDQKALITGIIEEQRPLMEEIASIRTEVCTELRKAMSDGEIDRDKVYSLIVRYGEIDGQLSGLYATRFAQVNATLTAEQRTALIELRDLDVVPEGAYLFSNPVAMPELPNTDYFFGIGNLPDDAGRITAPATFTASNQANKPDKPEGQSNDNNQDNGDRPPRPDNGDRPPKPDDSNRPPKPDSTSQTDR